MTVEAASARTPFHRAMILATVTLSQTLYGMTFLMVAVVLFVRVPRREATGTPG
jgi:hypothetical protein